MRFALDVAFLDAEGRVLRLERDVPPNRVLGCRRAAAVLEAPANMIPAMAEGQRNRLLVALDPRQPIYRDTYNEYFVFVLSAGGAAAGTQVPLYIVMALTDNLWSPGVFVAACVVFELAVIFGLARPQMTPTERLGWVGTLGGHDRRAGVRLLLPGRRTNFVNRVRSPDGFVAGSRRYAARCRALDRGPGGGAYADGPSLRRRWR